MKTLARSFFILIIFFFGGFYFPSASAQVDSSRIEDRGYDAFLRRMGFEDFSALLRKSLEEKDFLNKHLSPKVLKFQSERLETYNNARDLALEVLESLYTRNRNPESRDKIIEFTTRLLTTKPFQLDERLPDRYAKDPDGALQHVIEITRENIEKQSEILMADLINTLYGKEKIDQFLSLAEENPAEASKIPEVQHLFSLQKKVNQLVQFMYLDNEMGGFAVTAFGKAMVLGLTRYQFLNKKDNLIKKLKASLRNSGLYYENYVGRHLIVEGAKGTFKVEIRNGDNIFERSFGKQANEITAGIRPSGLQNWLFALRQNLMGSVIGRNFHTDDDSITKNPGVKEQLYKQIRETALMTNGVSHVGTAEVLTDPETGMQTTRSWDSYIDDGEGGIRVTDILHQFARKSEYLRLVVSRFDARKFAKYAQDYVKKFGYNEVAWMGDRENKDKTIANKDSVPWPTEISKEEFFKLHALAETDPEAYAEEIAKREVDGIKNLHRKGLAFAKGFSNSFGRGYCSFVKQLAIKMKTGIDPISTPDRWNIIVKLAKRMKMPGTENLDTNQKLVSPGAFLWQKNLMDANDIQVVDYPLLSTEERIAENFSPRYTARNIDLYRRLKTLRAFVMGAQSGSLEAAENTMLTTWIEDAITIRNEYGKAADANEHGRPRNSYLAQADRVVNRARERRDKGDTRNPSPSPMAKTSLSCSSVFKK